MIAPGTIVSCRQTGNLQWVVESQSPDRRWRIVRKNRNRLYTSRTAGEGDLTELIPAPAFEVGATVKHNGEDHIVAEAAGDYVTLIVPAKNFACSCGDHLLVPGGNTTTTPVADLILESQQW